MADNGKTNEPLKLEIAEGRSEIVKHSRLPSINSCGLCGENGSKPGMLVKVIERIGWVDIKRNYYVHESCYQGLVRGQH